MEIGHWLHQTGIEFSQADISAERSFAFSFADATAFHDAELQLSVIGEIAEEIAARGFAFDEADLRELAGNREVVLIGPEDAGAYGVDDAEGREADFGGNAAVAHPQKPASGFLF